MGDVQTLVTWLPPQPPAPIRADVQAVLTTELVSAVAGARRRVLRGGDRQIDTAHLLHALMEHDPAVRAAIGVPSQVARVLGYLVQRSIGYGLAWRTAVEDSAALPGAVDAAGPGRAAGVPAERLPDCAAPPVAALPVVAGWSPSAVAAMAGAPARARRRGDGRVGGTDVLACLAADPGCRAVEVLSRVGVDTTLLAARLSGRSAERSAQRPQGRSRHVSQG